MKQSTKAVLLSGLVFPGLGQLVLRHYVRGWVLLVFSLAAMWLVVRIALGQAQSVLDQVTSGEVPLDTSAIGELVRNASSTSDDQMSSIAFTVFIACWLIGIIDAYRIGSAAEKHKASPDIS